MYASVLQRCIPVLVDGDVVLAFDHLLVEYDHFVVRVPVGNVGDVKQVWWPY